MINKIILILKLCIPISVALLIPGCSDKKNLKDGDIVEKKVFQLNDKTLENKVNVSRITYISDGLKVKGFIISPADLTKKYPVLIYCRGGNREFGKIEINTLKDLSYFAAKYNYIILASQYRGNDGGEGTEEFGGRDVDDVLNIIKTADNLDYALKDEKYMLGESRGGMMAYIAIKNGAPVKAAVLNCGMTDLFDSYNEREQMMKNVMIELIGGTPKQKEDEYKSRSAYYWPEMINIPVMILAGGKDWRVKSGQAENMVKKLKENNKIFEYVFYPEGEHCLSKYSKEWMNKMADWFEKYK
jgi:dipeptidyl aminopeptidase/acylaminoacyl peptidase